MATNIQDGVYNAIPTVAAVYEKNDALKLEISELEMRMAALLSRLSAPRKGDHPDQLNAEYDALQEKLKELKSALEEQS